MKQRQSESASSMFNSLSSHICRGAILATFLASLLALTCSTSRAEVLVSEGFKTGSGSGYYSTTDKTSLSSSSDATYTQSTGFAVDKWQGATAVIVSRTLGLSYPSSFDGKMAAEGDGAIGYRGEGSAANWKDSTENKQEAIYRNQHRKIVSLNGSAGDKRYFRALMYADSTALGQLSTEDSWLSWRNGYSLGLATLPASPTATTSIMNCTRYMHFSFYRNKTENKYQMAFTVKGNASGEVAKRVTLCDVTAGHTYLVVAEITLGDGPETLRAFAYDCTADTGFDPDSPGWVDASGESTYTLIDGTDDLSLFIGGQYKTTGTVTFDEICVATDLNEVVPVADSYVSVSGTAAGNIATTSADLSASVGLKGVDSATPSVAWGLAADALTQSDTLDAITESGTVVKSLSGLDPMTTYYYRWTVSADGVDPATSPVASFKTKGDVVFGDVTADGLPSTGGVWASVDVDETGIAATTVTCYYGEADGEMTALRTWTDVQAGDSLVATNENAAWGTTYLFKFVAAFDYGGETHTYETPPASRQAVAVDFLKTTASGDWMDGSNWSLAVPPSEVIPAAISNVATMASLHLQDAAAAVKSISVKNGKVTVDMRGSSSISTDSISFGDQKTANLDNGVFAVTGGCLSVKGSVGIPGNTRTSRNVFELNGTEATIGQISTVTANDSGLYNNVHVYGGTVLTITNGLTVSYGGVMTVDASVVTNRKDLVVANNAKAGTLTLRNGAVFRQPWSSVTGVGGKGEGTLLVLSDSVFDASGASFYLGDQGDNSTAAGRLLVTNATFKAANFVSPRHSEFKGSYRIDVSGEDAKFVATGDVTLGCVSMQAGQYGKSGSTTLNVDGGSVTVGGTLFVGGGNNDRRKDYLTVSGATAFLSLGSLNCRTNAVVRFVVPETGYSNAAVIHAGGSVALAANMPPITIDATACKGCGWTSLFEADGGISTLTEENLSEKVVFAEVDGRKSYRGNPCEVRLVTETSGETTVVKALQFRVQKGGLSIIIR